MTYKLPEGTYEGTLDGKPVLRYTEDQMREAHAAERDSMTAENAALKADAERYRKIRRDSIYVLKDPVNGGVEFDAVIDAAIKGEKP